MNLERAKGSLPFMVLHFILTIFVGVHCLVIDCDSFIVQNVFRQAFPH